jgi:hypothetical protein
MDEKKTKKELINELMALRRQMAKMEESNENLKQLEETLKQKEDLFKFFVDLGDVVHSIHSLSIATPIFNSFDRFYGRDWFGPPRTFEL